MADPTWTRQDLTRHGLGRALVLRDPRAALTYWHSTRDYVLTGPDGRTRAGVTLGAGLEWCGDSGAPVPADSDLAWLEGAS